MRLTHCFPSTLETIVFFDLFDRPVHKDELTGNFTHLAVMFDGTYYFLRGRDDIVQKYQIQEKMWRRVARFRWLFAIVPFVRMVGVCNSLAMGTASAQSDIDLFVIADHHRFFTARLFLTVVLHFFGVRRHGAKIANRFCLSFFITDDALDLRSTAISFAPHDPYLTYWLRTVTPVTGFAIWKEFFRANHAENVPLPKHRFVDEKASRIRLRTFFGDILERFLARWQLRRAQKKQMGGNHASIVISPKMLKFHEHDRRAMVASAFQERLAKIYQQNK